MDKKALEEMLATMTRKGSSTLHIHPGEKPWMRVQGLMESTAFPAPDAKAIEELTRDFLFEDHRECLLLQGEVDVLYASRGGTRFRTTVMREERGLAVVFRRISSEAPAFDELYLPETLGGFMSLSRGLVLVAGFLGSGKSTTLAALVERINRESAPCARDRPNLGESAIHNVMPKWGNWVVGCA